MNAFDYRPAQSIEEAVALLAAHGDRARLLAGGTDILVHLREGRYDVDLLVDVKKIAELNELSFDVEAGLTIGAAVPCCQIYEFSPVRSHYPALFDSASIIGGVAIQGRATLGGNLCSAAPSADSVPSMIVLNGTCRVAGPQGERRIPVEKFNLGLGKNVMERGEMLVSLIFPVPPQRSGSYYQRFIPRHEMDIAVAGCGAFVQLEDDMETIQSVRLALATVAPTALLVEDVSQTLAGKRVSEETIEMAAGLARAAAKPRTTLRGTASQRRQLVGVLSRRSLWGAIARAKGE